MTPRTLAVSSMWNQASRLMIASPMAMKTHAGIEAPVKVSMVEAAK